MSGEDDQRDSDLLPLQNTITANTFPLRLTTEVCLVVQESVLSTHSKRKKESCKVGNDRRITLQEYMRRRLCHGHIQPLSPPLCHRHIKTLPPTLCYSHIQSLSPVLCHIHINHFRLHCVTVISNHFRLHCVTVISNHFRLHCVTVLSNHFRLRLIFRLFQTMSIHIIAG